MPQASLVVIDTRVLKEDYCNYDLIARYWNDEYRGRLWKNKQRVADCEGSDLDEIMTELRRMVDELQAEKRRKRGRRKPNAKDIAAALRNIEPKLSRTQKMMLSLQVRASRHAISIKSLIRLGEYGNEQRAFADYLQIANRLADELAYTPGGRRRLANPSLGLLITEDIDDQKLVPETLLVMQPEFIDALELLGW